MSTLLQKLRAAKNPATWKERKAERQERRSGYDVVRTSYTSLPVELPDGFLRPLDEEEKKRIVVDRIRFEETVLKEYEGCYAVVLDHVFTAEECEMIVGLAEMSAGAHGNAEDGEEVEDDGWKPAMVNAGVGREFLAMEYRNSDRIIWDEKEMVGRLWKRVCQAGVVEEDIGLLEGEKWMGLLGAWAVRRGEMWRLTEQGMNERMRFLRYGSGQYFREHTDGTYGNEEGERSFFTIHLYFNDSAQELEKEGKVPPKGMLRGGATTFHSTDMKERLDVDPKIGRVLIFQHRRLLHSGDDVVEGIKLTMRSDIMYKLEVPEEGGDVVFGN
ncbi:hypothetical protein ACMFMG_002039 [Clarireedia jacksonii]